MKTLRPPAGKTTFYCFSPPVMLFTFACELLFAVYVALHGLSRTGQRLIFTLLVCLAAFQLAEYQVCAVDRSLWAMRFGYVAITFLPALGVHLISLVTGKTQLRNASYLAAVLFAVLFLASAPTIQDVRCGGNYIIVRTDGVLAADYFPAYYFLLLGIAVWEIAAYFGRSTAGKSRQKLTRQFLSWLLMGYATFIVPTGAVYLLSPATRDAIPSVMCGFALFLAIVLALRVYPLSQRLKM